MLSRQTRYSARVPRHVPPTAYRSHPATVTMSLPNNPLLKRTRGIAIALVIFMGLLVSPAPSPRLCSKHGTTRKNDICICTWQDPSGSKKPGICDIKTHVYAGGQVTFQSIVVNELRFSFNDGDKLCEGLGMDVATPWNMEEKNYILSILPIQRLSKIPYECKIRISDELKNGKLVVSLNRQNPAIKSSVRKGKPKCNHYTNWTKNEPSKTVHYGVISSDGNWNDKISSKKKQKCVICETPRRRKDTSLSVKDCTATTTETTTETDSLSYSLTISPTVSKTSSRSGSSSLSQTPSGSVTATPTESKRLSPSGSSSLSQTPTGSHTISQSLTSSPTSSPTGSLTPSPTGSLTPSPTESLTPTGSVTATPTGYYPVTATPSVNITPYSRAPDSSPTGAPTGSHPVPATPRNSIPGTTMTPYSQAGHQCPEVKAILQHTMVHAAHLFTNGVEFTFTIIPLGSHGDKFVPYAVALLERMENGTVSFVLKCMTTLEDGTENYLCQFPPPPLDNSPPENENVSYIVLRYTPSSTVWCPLGIVAVVGMEKRRMGIGDTSFIPVCPVMTNALTDGSVFVIVARSPCAPKESQQGAKVAMHLIAPFSVFGPSAAVFGNIDLTVFLCVVGFAILYLGKHSGLDIFIEHPILKYKVGFRAIMLGMWFWLAELTYPGVVVGTFGLIRAGDNNNIGLGAVGCVYLVVVPVMAVVIMGPLRSLLVTYEEVNVGYLGLGYGMCHSQFTPHGMWGGTGPALGPLTQPFAGIRKAVWCAPLPYIVMTVVGAVLHATGPGTSCVARLATVTVLLFVVGVAIAATRPFRYNINNVIYTVSFSLLALYTALLAITASRHDVEHNSQEYSSDTAMGFAQLVIGVSLCLVFLVRGAVFVWIIMREGPSYRVFVDSDSDNDEYIMNSVRRE